MSEIPRSIGAVLTGIVAVVVLSVATDAVLEQSLFPGLAKGEATTQIWLIVTAYRCFYSVVGGYVAAWLSPSRPVLHAIILGCIGLALGLAGVIVAKNMPGPSWYPIAVAAQALPFCWLGGVLYARGSTRA